MKRRGPAAPPVYEPPPWVPLRAFLESPDFCGLKLSPVVAAIVDAADGQRVTSIDDATSRRIFNAPLAHFRRARPRPRLVGVVAGGQGGKTTRLGAPAMLHALLTVPLPNAVKPNARGELRQIGRPPRALIVAPDRDLADGAFEAARSYVAASPVMREAMTDALSGRARQLAEQADEDEYGGPLRKIPLRRSDGVVVELVVRAALKRGTSARSAPLVSFLLDESCFFETDGAAVTDAEILRAALQRLVDGGQGWLVSTPWEETIGELMRLVRERDEAPEDARHVEELVVGGTEEHHVTTRDLFPGWDPKGTIEGPLKKDVANHAREVLGIPLKSGSSRWFDPRAVDRAFALPAFVGVVEARGAGGDFAFESDWSAEVVTDRYDGGRYDLRALAYQVPDDGGLKPSVVCASAAELCAAHGVTELCADGHYRKSIEEHLEAKNITLVDAPGGNEGKWITFSFARDLLNEGRARLAGVPEPERFKAQLGRVLKRPLPGGRWQIYVPRSKGRGHADGVSAWVLSLWMAQRSSGVADVKGLADINATMTNPRRIADETYTDPWRETADPWQNPRYC